MNDTGETHRFHFWIFAIFIALNLVYMAGCGYVCPLCEGTGFSEGEECDFCKKQIFQGKNEQAISEQEEWIKKVHEGPCCSHDLEG